MYCTNCGAEVYEGANFCAKCGERIRYPEQEPEISQPAPDDAPDQTDGYASAIDEQISAISGLGDSDGEPLESLGANEQAVLTEFTMAATAKLANPKGFKHYLEIPPDARKTVLTLLGLLPLISADARQHKRPILYITPDSRSESHARLAYRRYMILSTPLEFGTWDDLTRAFAGGLNPKAIWVIGDLDFSGPPMGGDLLEEREKAVSILVRHKKTRALFIHKAGLASVAGPEMFIGL